MSAWWLDSNHGAGSVQDAARTQKSHWPLHFVSVKGGGLLGRRKKIGAHNCVSQRILPDEVQNQGAMIRAGDRAHEIVQFLVEESLSDDLPPKNWTRRSEEFRISAGAPDHAQVQVHRGAGCRARAGHQFCRTTLRPRLVGAVSSVRTGLVCGSVRSFGGLAGAGDTLAQLTKLLLERDEFLLRRVFQVCEDIPRLA